MSFKTISDARLISPRRTAPSCFFALFSTTLESSNFISKYQNSLGPFFKPSMSLTWQYRPVDLGTSIMADTKSTLACTTAQVQSSSVRFIQSSSSSLEALGSLPADQLVILFTPAIPREGSREDPFEVLGRALSKRHARVRHVPFVAKVGLTDLHAAWVRKAGAIIVVNCDPALLIDTKATGNMSSQTKFAAQVSDTLQALRGSSKIPLSCVHISPSSAAPASITGYDNLIVCSSYSVANMEKAASMLMC